MTELLARIEASGLATWTRESPSIWAYPTILTLHTFGLGVVVGANTVVNFRLLGYGDGIPLSGLRSLFPIMWWAFALNFITGILLFMADATHKSGQWIFYVKLGLIALALVTTRRAGTILAANEYGGGSRGKSLAWVSLLLWTGAIISGRLMAYI